jgi:hypothetical protein
MKPVLATIAIALAAPALFAATNLTVIFPGSTFHFEDDGNLAGQWITATNTRDQLFLSQTSEFSRAIPVQGPSLAPWRRKR